MRADDAHAREPAGVVRVPVRLRLRANRRVVPGEVRDVGEVRGGGCPGRDDAPRRARSRPSAARASSRAPVASASATSAVAEATPATAARRRPRSLEPEADPREATTTLGSTASRGGGGEVREGARDVRDAFGCEASGMLEKSSARDASERAARGGRASRDTHSGSAAPRLFPRRSPWRSVQIASSPRAVSQWGARRTSRGCYTENLPQKTRGGSSGRGRAGRTIKQCPKVETG